MARICFVHGDGHCDDLSVPDGTTVMRAAVSHSVAGIVGECGGQAMCATCHIYVSDKYLEFLPDMDEDEDEMLDDTVEPRDPVRSRLGCQLRLEGDIADLEVTVPGRQV
ncbi:ferredoxin (plasmid) [Rhodococcus erythropolis R138]|uniref:2Fe-2S iron-sulfur cluster-binding protein n=1 Tax=Rhodococcus erythropolis TaxID=1833 RepID=UPI000492B88B|nr:2Fe-2S iron-sulfur cluster-binding protein [Rhodococcus erythropolis]ALU73454.1 ferredoxin [Rhodococcus erythropolis R138]